MTDGRAGWGFRDMWAGANVEGMNSLRFCELALQTAPPFFLAFTDVQLGEWETRIRGAETVVGQSPRGWQCWPPPVGAL